MAIAISIIPAAGTKCTGGFFMPTRSLGLGDDVIQSPLVSPIHVPTNAVATTYTDSGINQPDENISDRINMYTKPRKNDEIGDVVDSKANNNIEPTLP